MHHFEAKPEKELATSEIHTAVPKKSQQVPQQTGWQQAESADPKGKTWVDWEP